MTTRKKTTDLTRPRKLDIAAGQKRFDPACGQKHFGPPCTPSADKVKPPTGWQGIDISPTSDAEIVHDLFDFPWPIQTSSVSEAYTSHFAEHIPHSDPRWPVGVDGWFLFWDEVHRIMKRGAVVNVIHPYVMSGRAFWDPTHVRFIHEASWYYLDPEWREAQQLDHYPTKANFQVLNVNGNGLSDDHTARSQDRQEFERTHYWNIVQDLAVTLKVRK